MQQNLKTMPCPELLRQGAIVLIINAMQSAPLPDEKKYINCFSLNAYFMGHHVHKFPSRRSCIYIRLYRHCHFVAGLESLSEVSRGHSNSPARGCVALFYAYFLKCWKCWYLNCAILILSVSVNWACWVRSSHSAIFLWSFVFQTNISQSRVKNSLAINVSLALFLF